VFNVSVIKEPLVKTAALSLLLFVSQVAAEPIEYHFSGTVIDRTEDDNSFGGLNVGDSFHAKFVFDAASPDPLPADPANGRYSAISASLQIPNLHVAQPGGVLDVSNDIAFDSLTFVSTGIDLEIRAVFTGESSALSSDSLPTEFLLMDNTRVLNVFALSGSDKFAGTITSAIAVPEPTVIAMMLVGFGGVCQRR
jgi:hypothetical protein